MKTFYKELKIILFIVGILLLLLNIYGLFIPLHSPLLNNKNLYKNKTSDEITMSKEEVFEKLKNKKGSDKEFVEIANNAIHEGILHYWDDELGKELGLQIPIYENYLLFLSSYIRPDIFKKYEFCGLWKKGVEQGVGWCTQSSALLTYALRDRDIESDIYVMLYHAVSLVKVQDNEWWVADPDYGVIIPHSIQKIESNPELIRPFYQAKDFNNEQIDTLIKIFDKNNPDEQKIGYIRDTNYCTYRHKPFEYLVYFLKWLIPLLLIFPLIYSSIPRKKYENE